MKVFLLLIGYTTLGVLVLLLFRDNLQMAQAIILFLTLLAILVYVADTNRLANYQSMQFRGMWIAGLFKDLSTRIDAFIRDIKKGDAPLKITLDFHISDIDNYFDVLPHLFPKREDKNYLREQQENFHKLWEDLLETSDTEKDIFINFLIDFKKEMQKRIGDMI